MKKLILMAMLLTAPAFAQTAPKPAEKHIYRPFRYETPCMLEAGLATYPDTCVVVETR